MSDKIDNWVPVSERLPDYKGDNDWCIVTSVTGAVNGALIDRDWSLPGWAIAWLDEPLPEAYVPPREPETVGFDEAKEIAKTHNVKRVDDDETYWFMRKGDRLVTWDYRTYPLTLSDLDGKFIIGERHTEDSNDPT